MYEPDIERAQRQEVRWRIMSTLNAARPIGAAESLLLQVLDGAGLPVTPHGLRRELGYLEEKQLIKVTQRNSSMWLAELTSVGIDVVEYTADCPPGINRPRKWY